MFKRKPFLSSIESAQIVAAIKASEMRTSGEIRVFVESRCKYIDALDRAAEVFYGLKMNETNEHNAVLIYLAYKDRQVAIFGDSGIHVRVGQEYWNGEVLMMTGRFHENHLVDGICNCINHIGEVLCTQFPYKAGADKNEIPDEIVFGK